MKRLLLLITICISSVSFGQISWTKTIGGVGDDYVNDVLLLDTFMVICGHTNSNGQGGTDAYVSKLDYNGNVIWFKTFGDVYNQSAKTVIQGNDGGYVFVGYSAISTGEPDIMITKISDNGDLIWETRYGESFWDNARTIISLNTNTYYVGAGGEINGTSSIVYDHNLIIDNNGVIIQDQVVGVPLNENYIDDAILADDGNIYYVGTSKVNPWHPSFRKLDQNGNFIMGKQYVNSPAADGFHSILEKGDGNFITSGYTATWTQGNNDFLVMELSSNGDILSQKSLGSTGNDIIWASYKDTLSGLFYFIGDHQNPVDNFADIAILEFDSNLNSTNTWVFGTENFTERGNIIRKKDSLWVIVGATNGLGNGGFDGLISVTTDLNDLCYQRPHSFVFNTTNFTTSAFGSITSSLASVKPDILVEGTSTLLDQTHCYNDPTQDCFPSYVPTDSLVGWWPFCGNANDESGNGNDGTVNGANLTSDRFGNPYSAYEFDGVDDEIFVLDDNELDLQQFTISGWVKPNTNDVNAREIAAKGPYPYNYGINLSGANNDMNGFYNDNNTYQQITSASNVSIGDWAHVVLTHDGNTAKLYINGVLESSASNSQVIVNNGLLYFGRTYTGFYMNGTLDDIGLWGRALTQCEISELYHAQQFTPPVDAGVDVDVCNGDDITLSGSGADTYAWSGGVTDGVAFGPTVSAYYYVTGTDTLGCEDNDSVFVTVLQPTTNAITESNCDSYTAPDGTTYTTTGNYTAVIPNAAGCDSTITIDLTITNSTSSSITETVCDTYTAPDGTIYTSSGNYTAVIPNAVGCDSTIALNLTINNLTSLDAGVDQMVCEGTDVTLTATGAASYAWSGGVSNGTPFPAEAGTTTYTVEGTDANGCTDQQSVNVTGTSYPELSFDVTNPACQGEASGSVTVLVNNGTSPFGFLWSNGVLQANNENIVAGSYSVTVTDDNGCESSGNVVVVDPTEPCFYISDGISPNGDGANDTWMINGLSSYPDAEVSVFNRWGQEVYSGTASSAPWDGTDNGKELPTADYYYVLDLGNGQTYNGVVTLKR